MSSLSSHFRRPGNFYNKTILVFFHINRDLFITNVHTDNKIQCKPGQFEKLYK